MENLNVYIKEKLIFNMLYQVYFKHYHEKNKKSNVLRKQ